MSLSTTVPDLIAITVDALIQEDIISASQALEAIDVHALRQERNRLMAEVAKARLTWQGRSGNYKRDSIGSTLEREVFSRDNYTCCYCGRKTIHLSVLKYISKALPDTLPYHPSWRFDAGHLVYWIYSTSLEHVIPVSLGGLNTIDNLRVACYLCNDAKKDIIHEYLGWQLKAPPAGSEAWSGLLDRYKALARAVDKIAPNKAASPSLSNQSSALLSNSSKKPESLSPEVRPLSFTVGNVIRARLPNKKQRRQYCVEAITPDNVSLREIWRDRSTGNWVKSAHLHTVVIRELGDVAVVMEQVSGLSTQ